MPVPALLLNAPHLHSPSCTLTNVRVPTQSPLNQGHQTPNPSSSYLPSLPIIPTQPRHNHRVLRLLLLALRLPTWPAPHLGSPVQYPPFQINTNDLRPPVGTTPPPGLDIHCSNTLPPHLQASKTPGTINTPSDPSQNPLTSTQSNAPGQQSSPYNSPPFFLPHSSSFLLQILLSLPPPPLFTSTQCLRSPRESAS